MISFMVPTSTLVADSGRCHFWPIDFAAVPRPKQPWPLYARYKWMAKAEPKGCPRTFCMMGEGIMWKISLALGEQRRSQTHIAMPQNWTGIAFKQSRHIFGLFFFKQVLHFFWVPVLFNSPIQVMYAFFFYLDGRSCFNQGFCFKDILQRKKA